MLKSVTDYRGLATTSNLEKNRPLFEGLSDASAALFGFRQERETDGVTLQSDRTGSSYRRKDLGASTGECSQQ